MNGVSAMDENPDDIKSPMRRLGSTRKLVVFNNIRLQLNEQLRCLDIRVESQVSLIQELQDFFRRRGELELDYSKSLDKLAKSLLLRHKEQKQKREQWPLFSSYACWQQLVSQTKLLSKDHAALSDIYSVHIVSRLQTVIEDVQRIYKRCREIGYETHEEILRVLQELHTTMKTYHSYQTECKAAEAKLRTAETHRMKLQQTIPKDKIERSKKYRLTEKEVLKRSSKYTDARLKALKAKNEYQLCIEASNTTIHKYFVEDLSDLIDCMDLGFGSMVSRAILMHVTADQGRCRAILSHADGLSHIIHSMDSRADKQKFLEQHHSAFMIPKRLEFQGHQYDEQVEPEIQKALHADMEQRLQLLGQRVNSLRIESDEIWKTLETAEINLLEHLNTKDFDTSGVFGDGTQAQSKSASATTTKTKADKQEIEEFYISKIREYILGTSRIARLDAKAELLRNYLANDPAFSSIPITKSNVPKRKRIGRMNMSGQPKLFGGSLEEYLEATAEEIPLIMRSCIRVINLYGLHHQGIFRVSGSQVEISNFREAFERGEDPLADTTDASDINSVAGVLKLYLRELLEPLFPIIYFEQFMSLAQLDSKQKIVFGIKKFLKSLPRSVVIVIRYLFAFLNHLSEYSDENMMDAYNLAICFGPTLMPAPEDKDQVQYQNQVNELIKNMIVYNEELFPKDFGGLQYEKYISEEPFIDIDVGDSPTEQLTEDLDSEVYPSEDESEMLEATVQFDFSARSNRELSLRKGEHVILRKQVSNDWWQGSVDGKDGLVPDKYISLKIKDEDRDKNSDQLKLCSSDEFVRKRRLSENTAANSQLSFFTQQEQHMHQLQIAQQQQSRKTLRKLKLDGGTSTDSGRYQDNLQNRSSDAHLNLSAVPTQKIAIQQTLIENIDFINIDKLTLNVNCDLHYDTVGNVREQFSYHDEPHSFETSMDFLEDLNDFQFEVKKQQTSEPIYAEPSKPNNKVNLILVEELGPALSNATRCTIPKKDDFHFNEYEGGIFRSVETVSSTFCGEKSATTENSSVSKEHLVDMFNDNTNRHSDGNLFKDSPQSEDGEDVPLKRKFHLKSLSVCENRNLFQQNKELWEKRAELSHSQSRILERKRIAPDLVMDLPFLSKDPSLESSRDSLDVENKTLDEITSAERFATQNQCTLKKNERFSSSIETMLDKKEIKFETNILEKSKIQPQVLDRNVIEQAAEKKAILEEILHIEEDTVKTSSACTKIRLVNSPIPVRNTQKYVSQFADLKLTGGCLNQKDTAESSATRSKLNEFNPQLSSFKPQVKLKPNIFKKPFVQTSSTPEMEGRSTNSNSGNECPE